MTGVGVAEREAGRRAAGKAGAQSNGRGRSGSAGRALSCRPWPEVVAPNPHTLFMVTTERTGSKAPLWPRTRASELFTRPGHGPVPDIIAPDTDTEPGAAGEAVAPPPPSPAPADSAAAAAVPSTSVSCEAMPCSAKGTRHCGSGSAARRKPGMPHPGPLRAARAALGRPCPEGGSSSLAYTQRESPRGPPHAPPSLAHIPNHQAVKLPTPANPLTTNSLTANRQPHAPARAWPRPPATPPPPPPGPGSPAAPMPATRPPAPHPVAPPAQPRQWCGLRSCIGRGSVHGRVCGRCHACVPYPTTRSTTPAEANGERQTRRATHIEWPCWPSPPRAAGLGAYGTVAAKRFGRCRAWRGIHTTSTTPEPAQGEAKTRNPHPNARAPRGSAGGSL